ncbi:hypothetical protein P3T73_05150 [Kiritimatiellota bacterium B12222]|nr:hypothetical protein P3T73_05150 [Kiritimatiellota bacterium B12222]
MSEASGWVAYNCGPGESEEMEDYRVVVIRQKTGEAIYDSQVRLAADLCTHGFEMAFDDPRLQRLAENVDTEIIEPLEAYQKSVEQIEAPVESPAPAPPTSSVPEAKEVSISEAAEAPKAQVDADTVYGQDPLYEIKSASKKEVVLIQSPTALLQVGDRLFLRKRPQVMAIPGTDENVLISEGDVTGLVEVVSVDKLTVTTQLLTGEAPADGIAEKAENP